jgi:capsular exopolysaccharide synthesis family protein
MPTDHTLAEPSAAQILWRGKYLIALAVAVGVGLAILATRLSTKVYEATTLIQVRSAAPVTRSTDPFAVQQASQGLATTYATVLNSKGFMTRIAPTIAGGTLTGSQLASRVDARAITTGNDVTTDLIEVHARAHTPENAVTLARAVASEFVRSVRADAAARSADQQRQIRAQIASLSSQIRALRGRRPNGAVTEELASLRGARSALTGQLAALVTNGIEEGASVGVVTPATSSTRPVRPRPVLNIVAGVLLGLLGGAGLAWLRAFLDRGLHSSQEVEGLLGVPVLASVPIRKRFSADDPVLAEAYDVLRANLVFASLDQPVAIVTLTSFNPREGKTSTALGLAYAAARAGVNVLLVDGDVRTQTLSQRLGHDEAPGLTTALSGWCSLDDALTEVETGLSLLPAGAIPPNPPSVLSSGRMHDLVGELRERYSLVIIDSPPVAHLADPSILASYSDAVVVVARVGVTARADLPAMATTLRQSPTPIVGAVVLEPREVEQTYYYPTRRTEAGSQLGTRS